MVYAEHMCQNVQKSKRINYLSVQLYNRLQLSFSFPLSIEVWPRCQNMILSWPHFGMFVSEPNNIKSAHTSFDFLSEHI